MPNTKSPTALLRLTTSATASGHVHKVAIISKNSIQWRSYSASWSFDQAVRAAMRSVGCESAFVQGWLLDAQNHNHSSELDTCLNSTGREC